MDDYTMEGIEWLSIKTVEEGLVALRYLEKQMIIIGKRIKAVIFDFRDSLKQRYWTQFRNEMISMLDVFQVKTLQDYAKAAAIFGSELAGSLYQVHQGFEGMKNVIIQAAAPIAQILLPVVQTAISFFTEFALVVGNVLRFLILGADRAEDFGSGVKTAASTTKALKKSLAGFDQINRLNGKEGSVGGITALQDMSGSWKSIAAKMQELFKPLKELDLSAAAASLERLKKALEPLTQTLFAGLEWAWHNLFVPLANWTVTQLLPVFLDTLTTALQAMSRVIEALQPDFQWLWEKCLQPLAQWKGDQIIGHLQGIITELNRTSDWLGLNQGPVDDFIDSVRNIIQAAGELAQETVALSEESESANSAMTLLRDSVLGMFNPFEDASGMFWLITSSVKALGYAFNEVTTASSGVLGAIGDISNNGWPSLRDKFINPTYSGIRQTMNKMVDLVNTLLRSATTGINFLGSAMNSLSFTVPSWVPGIGGKGFSFSVKTLTPPQIPYLAKGAVLPANKPFMAVVGDQKHGTNVEAPLTVIQEAVAAVMEDYSSANMAGHQATVAVLQELLSAVLGIRIGEDMLSAAADRYERKMAVVRGGYV